MIDIGEGKILYFMEKCFPDILHQTGGSHRTAASRKCTECKRDERYKYHQSADPDDVIGKGEAWIEDEKLIVRITFEPADLNPRADKIFRKLQFGSLHAVSVGFRATKKGHMGDEEHGEDPKVYYYAGQELLEVSVVNIPSNANALKRSMEEEEASREYEEKAEAPETVTDVTVEEPADYTSTIARARALLAKNV
jgi:HK97 family phage prohead protease